jgi:hypothetical protein
MAGNATHAPASAARTHRRMGAVHQDGKGKRNMVGWIGDQAPSVKA